MYLRIFFLEISLYLPFFCSILLNTVHFPVKFLSLFMGYIFQIIVDRYSDNPTFQAFR